MNNMKYNQDNRNLINFIKRHYSYNNKYYLLKKQTTILLL